MMKDVRRRVSSIQRRNLLKHGEDQATENLLLHQCDGDAGYLFGGIDFNGNSKSNHVIVNGTIYVPSVACE